MMFVIVGRRTNERCLRSDVGIGSRSQLVSGDIARSLEASSAVAR
jgi:hypothetical protein